MSDLWVLVLVLAFRLLAPLLIPRFPLPGIILALAIDGIDQTIFQSFATLNIDEYQSYDKALDVYYFTIAYLATMRNWSNLFAFEVSRALFYYRLIGVVVFEYTDFRWVLLIFPNTFEYFFIFYELVRLRWDPRRMTRNAVIGAAAFIWIVIKLPQEHWVHVAQLDVTEQLAANPAAVPALIAAIGVLARAVWWLVTQRLPAADRSPSLADPVVGVRHHGRWDSVGPTAYLRLVDWKLFEKIALVSLVSIIFAQMLPSATASGLQMTIGVALLIVGNTVVSEWLSRRGIGWTTVVRQFGATAVINAGLTLAWYYLLPISNGSLHLGNTMFFLLLLTLVVTLYDAYHLYHGATVTAAT